jgi:hypothetical protein
MIKKKTRQVGLLIVFLCSILSQSSNVGARASKRGKLFLNINFRNQL